ncbi:MAG: YjgP/YjgQ family permease [Desulfobacteraceae bacterium]|nr:MAG: YjgP/YjgQ family permease [Desulfobacteraceae bacterium]
MRKIDKLIFRAVTPPFLITLTVLTFIVFISKIGSWSKLLIANNASLGTIFEISAEILPTILIFSLPLSYLIGILIGVSGLNGENQITALKACGVPVRRLLRQIFILGTIVGIATAIISTVVLPKTNEIIKIKKEQILLSQAPTALEPRVFNADLPNMVFYLEDLSENRKDWSRVFVADNTDKNAPRTILAQSGTLIGDADHHRLQLHLENGSSYSIDMNDPGIEKKSYFDAFDIPIALPDPDNTAGADKPLKAAELGTLDLWHRASNPESNEQTDALVEFNQRISLPFSVFPFALLGLTLAVSAKKGGRTSGFALSLIAVLLFYVLFFNGIRFALIGKISPWLGPWAANIFLGFIGIFLLIKVERSLKSDSWLSMDRWKYRWEKLGARYHLEPIQSGIARFDNKLFHAISAIVRFLFPKIFDLYIAKGFLTYFSWSLATCSLLFILLTLFELLDDAIRNGIEIMQIVIYFIFLMPQILMMAIPLSVLLAILISLGILENNSEITAIKAGGWSLYRISIPIFLLAAGFCVSLFIIQDYILPYSNERQDAIWNKIKGRAPQTTMLKRKWILGESGRIYNYEYFDEKQNSFVGLNIYEMDLDAAKMIRRMYASRAVIRQGAWILDDGWIRDYHLQQNGFRTFKTENFFFPEKADYFEKEIFQPKESSKMTYYELNSHINYLMKSGYNAKELQVELNKKISFPLSCLTMTLLAFPFSFIIGKRGAFFGIGASIAIAISFLMISGLFETMGTYGILTPFLAAWAPNIIFGAAGFWLLLSVRT